MSEFLVTGPDGKKYRVQGETAEGAARAVAQMLRGGGMAERVAAARAGTLQASPESLARAASSDQIAGDRMTIARFEAGRPGRSFAGAVARGVPFAGEWIDEAADKLNEMGVPGVESGDVLREATAAYERQSPGANLAGQVVGGVAATIPLAAGTIGAKAADFVARGGTMLTRALRGAAVAGSAGAAEGAVSGAGAAEDGGRMSGAASGAALGGGLGAVLGSLAPMVGEGVANLARRIKRLDVATIAEEFGLSAPAARVVKSYLANDDLDAAARILARGGDDAMLANAGPATRQALDSAMATGGQALSVARGRIDAATSTAGQRFQNALDTVLGHGGGIRSAARGIAQRTSGARQAAYDRAYGSAIDYAGDAGRQIEEVLSRIPPNTLKAAIAEANEAMTAAGIRNRQIMAFIADDGAVAFREMPNVQQLDEIKKALGALGRAEVDQFGRPTARGMRANALARQLSEAMGAAVPDYQTAVRLGGDKIAEDQALAVGRSLLSARTTIEDVRDAMRGAADDVRAAARRGLRENIDAIMGRARSTIADMESGAFDFNTGQNAAKEAMDALRSMTLPENMSKVRLVLGSNAKQLFDEMQRMSDALVLRAAVARGSATAIRQSGQQQIADEVAPGVVRRAFGNLGNPLEAAREISQTVAGIDPRSMSEAQRAYFTEIADALTRIRGAEAQRALVAVQAAMRGQPLKDEQARLIGRVVAGSAGVGAYQTGTQLLGPQ